MSRRRRLGAVVVALALLGWSQAEAQDTDCAAPAPVCAARGAVFALGSRFDPLASAVRIGPDLLVTSHHVMADEARAELRLRARPAARCRGGAERLCRRSGAAAHRGPGRRPP